MKITFTRLGQSLANTLQIISNRDQPHPLADLGRQQAEALSQTLSRTRFERNYTSSVPRAVEAGQILSERLNSPLSIDPALRKYDFGNLKGRGDPEAWQIQQRFVQN